MRPIDADAINVKSEIESVREVVEIILDEAPTLNAIVIPENVTNGDMVKAMFDVEIVDDFYQSVGIKLNGSNYYIQFNKDWWNASYKGAQS